MLSLIPVSPLYVMRPTSENGPSAESADRATIPLELSFLQVMYIIHLLPRRTTSGAQRSLPKATRASFTSLLNGHSAIFQLTRLVEESMFLTPLPIVE